MTDAIFDVVWIVETRERIRGLWFAVGPWYQEEAQANLYADSQNAELTAWEYRVRKFSAVNGSQDLRRE